MMTKATKHDTMLRATILSAEALLARHLEVLDREVNPEQDYEVFELRETIIDAKVSITPERKPC